MPKPYRPVNPQYKGMKEAAERKKKNRFARAPQPPGMSRFRRQQSY